MADWRQRIGELGAATGVTVRTLHHYDEIGLLVPSRSEAGQRLYTPEDLIRLYQIVALRRLGFGLAEIAAYLNSRDFDPQEVVRRQLAELKRQLELQERLQIRLTVQPQHRRNRRIVSAKTSLGLDPIRVGQRIEGWIELGEKALDRRIPAQLPPKPVRQRQRDPPSSPGLPSPEHGTLSLQPPAEPGLSASLPPQRSRLTVRPPSRASCCGVLRPQDLSGRRCPLPARSTGLLAAA
jgi:DNA-binding transcriptional MerR regulator